MWLDRRNKEAAEPGRPADTRLIDTTDRPERYGYSGEPAAIAEKKSPAQLEAEIAEVLTATKGRQ